ncbi:MAG: flavodoxin family protein [Oscillospiraceae bacterium]|nr:flavodoxin family protein [Oscillospiraceae bacterium]
MDIINNILILTGSPHKHGTSSLLADEFEHGAVRSGNSVKRFDTAFLNINCCMGCGACRNNSNFCTKKDDFDDIKNFLLNADVVVFVTPIYYFSMSAQLKMTIDRFHSISKELQKNPKKSLLIMTAASPDKSVANALILHYKTMIKYLGWEDVGILLAKDSPTREKIEQSNYPFQARKLGEILA